MKKREYRYHRERKSYYIINAVLDSHFTPEKRAELEDAVLLSAMSDAGMAYYRMALGQMRDRSRGKILRWSKAEQLSAPDPIVGKLNNPWP